MISLMFLTASNDVLLINISVNLIEWSVYQLISALQLKDLNVFIRNITYKNTFSTRRATDVVEYIY